MKKICTYIIILLISLAAEVSAADLLDRAFSESLLEKINDARTNPVSTLVSLGINPCDAIKVCDEDVISLSPLVMNTALVKSTEAHLLDMFERDYYATESPEGVLPIDRADAAGYVGDVVTEELGMVGFVAYMAPEDAVDLVFENMVEDDIAKPEDDRTLFNPLYKEIGISIGTGAKSDDRGRFVNLYLAVCDYAVSGITPQEQLWVALVNNARTSPEETAASLGLGASSSQVLPMGKLQFNYNIYNASASHAKDMLTNFYFDYESPQGGSIADRMRTSGYPAEYAAEVLASQIYDSNLISLNMMIKETFQRKFVEEWYSESSGQLKLLSPVYEDIGVRVEDVDLGLGIRYLMIVSDIGKKKDKITD